VSFTDRALSIDYRDLGGGCDLHLGTGADTYQLFVPEPGGVAAAVAAVGALVALRRRG
jgi:hypothetical protein